MNTITDKIIRSLLAFAMVIGGLALASSRASAAAVSINLCASNGSITMPDSVVVPVWGFVLNPGTCTSGLVNDTNFPGPLLDVNQGDVVTINLSSALPAGHTASFELPGLSVTNPAGQHLLLLRPGTFVYQSPGDSGRQMAMGLYGALIVRPTSAPDTPIPGQAYAAASTAYDVEATLILSQIDPVFNAAPDTFNMNNYLATYWLINGKAYPDTAPIVAGAGQRALLRYVNAGYDNTSMMLLGMHEQVLARDAYLLNNPFLATPDHPGWWNRGCHRDSLSYGSAQTYGFRSITANSMSPMARPRSWWNDDVLPTIRKRE
jgi:FtsP/CotA-like multicopper oxidase with cupredoxin domain